MRAICATKLRWTTYECSILLLVSVYDPEAPHLGALRTTKYLEEAFTLYQRVSRGEIDASEWRYIKALSAVLRCA